MKSKSEQMTKRQEEYLMDGLKDLRKGQYDWPLRDDTAAEAKVREEYNRLRRSVARIDADKDKLRKLAMGAWERQLQRFKKLILFGSPKEAIARLEELQEEYRNL